MRVSSQVDAVAILTLRKIAPKSAMDREMGMESGL
jgi:hypothetical protein